MKKIKTYVKYGVGILILFLLIVIGYNVLEPLIPRSFSGDSKLSGTSFESDQEGKEQILCIDDNEEALLWRLRMIAEAKETITLATFDLRPDDSGTKVMSALSQAARRGVQVKLLIDGIYEIPFLNGSDTFHALVSQENVETRIYNPIDFSGIFRANYRMHDKYLIVDHTMYLCGGRNTNDIFLGDHPSGTNADRDILVYDTTGGDGASLNQLQNYFDQIWMEPCVKVRKKGKPENYQEEYCNFTKIYQELQKEYPDMESFDQWERVTYPANKITLITNGTQPKKKNPQVLQTIVQIAREQSDILIQTPYVICDRYMYNALKEMADQAEVKMILNAVEKGSNPWGCTDYLNHKEDILKTGVEVYELMNEQAVHTKAVLAGDRLSIVGSYNFDMRSTYLDTEFMLVIDSTRLNTEIRSMEEAYMKKSIEITPDGQTNVGPEYQEKQLSQKKRNFYKILRILIRPIRHLL